MSPSQSPGLCRPQKWATRFHKVRLCSAACHKYRCWRNGNSIICWEIIQKFSGLHYIKCVSSVQSLSPVWLFVTPWTAARQASRSITKSRSLPKLMSVELVMPSNHLILCHPLLLPPSIFPSIRAFSNESALHIRWPKYWSFSFNISPSNEHPGLISLRMD